MKYTEAINGWKPQHNTCIWAQAQLLESEPFGLGRLPAWKLSIDAQITTMRFYFNSTQDMWASKGRRKGIEMAPLFGFKYQAQDKEIL